MPVKHVRFADNFECFLSPRPLSATLSDSSPFSSPGPSTPPPLNYEDSPYSTTSLPSVPEDGLSFTALRVYGTLAFHQLRDPQLQLDVRDHPSVTPLTYDDVRQPVTKPSLQGMTIIIENFPWEIRIPASNGSAVTVGDILGGVHGALRINAVPDDFERLPSDGHRDRVREAFKRRYERLQSPHAHEEYKKGLKRVDFLMDRTRWLGLATTSEGPNIWRLVVGKPRRSAS